MKKWFSALLIAGLVVMAAACGGGGGDDASTGGGDKSPSSEETKSDGGNKNDSGDKSDSGAGSTDCGKTGDGIVRVFCDGPAVVNFTIDGETGTIKGGECGTDGGYFWLNAGTVVDPSFTGDLPDYAGFTLPLENGEFDTVTAAGITTKGKMIALRGVKGTHDDKSGSITGTGMAGEKVSAEFTC
jgi:hypothetical protein